MIEVRTLRDGAQDPNEVADALIRYFDGARESLLAAIYDIHLSAEIEARGRDALRAAAGRGVEIRVVIEQEDAGPRPAPRAAADRARGARGRALPDARGLDARRPDASQVRRPGRAHGSRPAR